MRNLLLITLCFISSIFNGNAENINVQKLEGEIRAGITLPLDNYRDGSSQVSGDIGIEGRYNFQNSPFDCGLMLELSTARRGFNHLFADNFDRWQNNRTIALAILGDYNFRQGKKINPFVGAALGVASNDVVGDKYYPTNGTSILLAPRVGIELLHHIRLMAQFNVCRKGYNNLSLTFALVIGGKPKQ